MKEKYIVEFRYESDAERKRIEYAMEKVKGVRKRFYMVESLDAVRGILALTPDAEVYKIKRMEVELFSERYSSKISLNTEKSKEFISKIFGGKWKRENDKYSVESERHFKRRGKIEYRVEISKVNENLTMINVLMRSMSVEAINYVKDVLKKRFLELEEYKGLFKG